MTGAFSERLLPAPVGGGFAMPGYWVWCGSAIGDDGIYLRPLRHLSFAFG
jgi:hypothetical protein